MTPLEFVIENLLDEESLDLLSKEIKSNDPTLELVTEMCHETIKTFLLCNQEVNTLSDENKQTLSRFLLLLQEKYTEMINLTLEKYNLI